MILDELESVLRSRLEDPPAGSYSAGLMADREKLQRKLMEEAFEVCLELGRPVTQRDRVAEEAADLLFHLMAALVAVGVPHDEVLAVLDRRRGG